MSILESKIIIPGLLFLLTLASGVWLSKSGKPLNTLILTIHKLIALAAVILTGLAIFNLLQTVEISALVITPIVIAGLCVLALFSSGAFLSLGKPVNKALLATHTFTPVLAILSTAWAIYLLVGGK